MRNPERIIAELWEAESIPESISMGLTPVHAILDERPYAPGLMDQFYRGNPTVNDRDVMVVNSTIQWLGTNIGMSFVRKFLAVSQIHIN